MLESQKVMKALRPARMNRKQIRKLLEHTRKVSNTSRGVSYPTGKGWSLAGNIQNREEKFPYTRKHHEQIWKFLKVVRKDDKQVTRAGGLK